MLADRRQRSIDRRSKLFPKTKPLHLVPRTRILQVLDARGAQ